MDTVLAVIYDGLTQDIVLHTLSKAFHAWSEEMIRNFLKKLLSIALSLLMVIPAAHWEAAAQQPTAAAPAPSAPTPAPGESNVQGAPLSAYQLQQIVAPIALYPDALVAQVLGQRPFPTRSLRRTPGFSRTANFLAAH